MKRSVFAPHGPNLSLRGFFIACILLSLAFGFAILSDLFIPSVKVDQPAIIFHSMLGIILTLSLLALKFLLIGMLALWVVLKDRTQHGKSLLWRRLMVIPLVFLLFLLLSFSVLYLTNKRVTITSNGMRLDTLFSAKEVSWSNSEVVNHNFVDATRLGPPFTRRSYTFIEFRTREGEIVHFDLRFIGDNRLLEQIIRQHTNFDPPR